jgi:hypothetical protein
MAAMAPRAGLPRWSRRSSPAMKDLLTDNATFHSPVTDYRGRERVGEVLGALAQVVAGARLTRRFDGAPATAAFFTATLDGRPADGALLVVATPDGQVGELTLLVRPLRSLLAGIEQMKVLLSGPSARVGRRPL